MEVARVIFVLSLVSSSLAGITLNRQTHDGASIISGRTIKSVNKPVTLPLRHSVRDKKSRKRGTEPTAIGLGDALDITYNVVVNVGNISAPLVLDTGSADMWILSDACKTCSDTQRSPPGLDLYPMDELHRVTDVELFYGDSRTGTQASGVLGSDSVGVAGLSVKNQYFAAINRTNTSVLDTGSNGIFGLGFPVNSILWNELYTIAVLGYYPERRRKRSPDLMHANNRQLPARPPTAENYVEGGNVESTMDMPGASMSVLSSFATYGPLLPRLILSGDSTNIPSPQFSITLERTSPTIGGNIGALTLGGLPQGVSNSSLTWVPVRRYTPQQNGVIVPEAREETYPYAWEVPLQAITFNGVKLEMSTLGDVRKPGVGTTALVDTGNSLIRGPADVIVSILTLLLRDKGRSTGANSGTTSPSSPASRTSTSPSHSPSPNSHSKPKPASAAAAARVLVATYDPYDYVYPCTSMHNLTFTLGGRAFPVDPRDFGRQAFAGDTQWCVPNLAPTDAPMLGDYLYSWSLGQPFLKGVLTSFYYGNITHPSKNPPRVGLLSTVPDDITARFAADMSAAQAAGEFLETTIQAPTGTFTNVPVTTDAHGVVQVSEVATLYPGFTTIPGVVANNGDIADNNVNDAQAFAPARATDHVNNPQYSGDNSRARILGRRRSVYMLAVALSAAVAMLTPV